MARLFEKAMIIVIASIAFALLVLSHNNTLQKTECNLRKGIWSENSRKCSYPPADYLDICYENSDCNNLCVFEDTDDQQRLYGRCSRSPIVCDYPAIPFQTSDKEDLEIDHCRDPKKNFKMPLQSDEFMENSLMPGDN